jgi:hypothetical protein
MKLKEIHQTNARLAGLTPIQPHCGVKEMQTKRPRDPPKKGHVLSYTRERRCHRMDLKDVACVNMQDSS